MKYFCSTRWECQGEDWRAGIGCQAGRCWDQREAAWEEEAGGEGQAAVVEEAGPWRGCKLEEAGGEVMMVRWR